MRDEGWAGEGVAKVDHTAVLHRVAWQPKSGHHGDSDLFAGHTHAPRFGSSALECRPLPRPPTPTLPTPHVVSPVTFSGPLDLIVVANFSLFLPPLLHPQLPPILSHAYIYIYREKRSYVLFFNNFTPLLTFCLTLFFSFFLSFFLFFYHRRITHIIPPEVSLKNVFGLVIFLRTVFLDFFVE